MAHSQCGPDHADRNSFCPKCGPWSAIWFVVVRLFFVFSLVTSAANVTTLELTENAKGELGEIQEKLKKTVVTEINQFKGK